MPWLAAEATEVSKQDDGVGGLKLNMLQNEAGPFCLDGSQPGWYQRVAEDSANAGKWVIYFSGGAMCLTNDDCTTRMGGTVHNAEGLGSIPKGSSDHWPQRLVPMTQGVEPMVLRSPDSNPDFQEWNHALFPYCSGDEWLGQATEKVDPWAELNAAGHTDDLNPFGWVEFNRTQVEGFVKYASNKFYFQGHLILKALIKAWTAANAKVTEVILVGSSSGSLAVYYNADYFKAALPDARVVAVPVAGWFGALHAEDVWSVVVGGEEVPKAVSSANQDAWVLHTNAYLPPAVEACKKANPGKSAPWCYTVEHLYPYTATDMFVADSITDEQKYKQGCVLCEAGTWGRDGSELFRYQKAATHRIATSLNHSLAKKPNDGFFLVSCFTHVLDYSDRDADGQGNTRKLAQRIGGTTLQQAVRRWYFKESGWTRLLDRAALDRTDVLEGKGCGCKAAAGDNIERRDDPVYGPVFSWIAGYLDEYRDE